MLYINIHNHTKAKNDELSIENRYNNFEQITKEGRYSIDLHPWYISAFHWKNELRAMQQASRIPSVLAIGECGLDRQCSVSFTLQEEVFAAQVQWANAIGKPLIIHCVRAWDEVLSLLKKEKNSMPVVFHGYTKNAELAQRIIAAGYYLSFGKALQYQQAKSVIASVPADKILLETDDSAFSIDAIYKLAAQALLIDNNSLSLRIQKNAATFFGAAAFNYDN
ncbi:MAG: TatD family hydrolase [Chitinophagaceae bacterium]|nr:TatD family hydrolase [Chitinophagaceae bacterium]